MCEGSTGHTSVAKLGKYYYATGLRQNHIYYLEYDYTKMIFIIWILEIYLKNIDIYILYFQIYEFILICKLKKNILYNPDRNKLNINIIMEYIDS